MVRLKAATTTTRHVLQSLKNKKSNYLQLTSASEAATVVNLVKCKLSEDLQALLVSAF